MNRRGFLGSILAFGAAPAIVRADSLMRVVPRETTIINPFDTVIVRKYTNFGTPTMADPLGQFSMKCEDVRMTLTEFGEQFGPSAAETLRNSGRRSAIWLPDADGCGSSILKGA